MTLWRKIVALLDAKSRTALERLEDPRDALERAYRLQVAALTDARRAVADVLTSERRLEIEMASLASTAEQYRVLARDAVRVADDARARVALSREAAAADRRDGLALEIGEIRAEREALEAMAERIRERAERTRAERVAVGARYAAARATARVGAAVVGVSDDALEIATAVERAREKVRDAQARACALVTLAASGYPPDEPRGQTPEAVIEERLALLKRRELR